ncbi:MAG: DUF374 domain-containing protein [Nitrospirae bacterium]|nr:MAG: DUF374 domain-containing protein [Nitrospirota bacterium]
MKKNAKKILKKLKKRLAKNILPVVIYCFMRVLYSSLRVSIVGREIPDPFHNSDRGVVFAFWHSMLLAMAGAPYGGRSMHVLVSRHGDGELIGEVMRLFGFSLVRGSSSKGGGEALKELVTLIQKSRDISITPDGPRGPAEEAKPGIAQLARLTGAPVIPVAYSGSRLTILKTWDRFRIPCPFSKIHFVVSEPLFCQEGEDVEAFRLRIETALREVTARADAFFS